MLGLDVTAEYLFAHRGSIGPATSVPREYQISTSDHTEIPDFHLLSLGTGIRQRRRLAGLYPEKGEESGTRSAYVMMLLLGLGRTWF